MKNYFKIFEFISDEKLKKDLVLDYKEVLICMNRQAYKGAVVLAGGIVEAILINRALSLPPEDIKKLKSKYQELSKRRKNITEMDLFYLIKSLTTLEIISIPQAGRSDILRDYRNLIHPFKKGDRPTKSDATSVKTLLDGLISEFGKEVELKPEKINKSNLFFTHPKWKSKREKIEYMEILALFYKKQRLTFEELLKLPSFQAKKNPSKSLIACLIYLKSQDLCDYDPKSWKIHYYKRYEIWRLNSTVKSELKSYLDNIKFQL